MRFYIRGGGQLSKRDNTGEIKDLGSSSGGGSNATYKYYCIMNTSLDDLIKQISSSFNMVFLMGLYDNDYNPFYGEIRTLITRSCTRYIRLRTDVFPNTASYDDRWKGQFVNISIYGSDLIEVLLFLVQGDEEVINQIKETIIEVSKEEYYRHEIKYPDKLI